MKRISIKRQGETLTIVAPADKEMVVDHEALRSGVLSIGEYGPSGIKIAAFHTWDEAIYDAEDRGYTLNEENPF